MEEEGNKQVQNYILQRTLGQGTFGKVKLAYHTITDEYVAVKVLEKSRIENCSDLVRVQREIAILRKVNHPNIIKLYEILESEQCVYLVMEFAKGGELYDYIIKKKFLTEQIAVRFFQQIVFATEYLHSQNITHRDLKPENMLLDENRQLKIADFGLSFVSNGPDEYLKTACGSPCYAAPEMLIGRTYDGPKSDIWSCGIILFAMLCGYLPFEHENTKQLYELIKTSDFEKPEHLSKNALDLLTKILVKDPEKRLNFEQIKQHPFFQIIHPIPRKGLALNDQNILLKMVEMGYPLNQITFQLQQNKHNTLTTIYYLLQKKQNQPHRRSFFQNIQNIANQKLDINKKRQTLKFQSPNQGSPLLEKIGIRKRSIKSRLDNSPYLQTQVSQKFKKYNLSVQSKRVSVQLENIRQKTYSVQEKNYDPLINDSNIQSRKNSKHKYIKPSNDCAIKTEVNDDVATYFKSSQVKTRNKTQPSKNEEEIQKFFNRNSKANASHQVVLKTPQHNIYVDLSNHRVLNKQLLNKSYDVKQQYIKNFKVVK